MGGDRKQLGNDGDGAKAPHSLSVSPDPAPEAVSVHTPIYLGQFRAVGGDVFDGPRPMDWTDIEPSMRAWSAKAVALHRMGFRAKALPYALAVVSLSNAYDAAGRSRRAATYWPPSPPLFPR